MAANTEGDGDGPIPLLNEYKHALPRRRLLQSLTGGAKIRRVPYYVHLIQLILWVLPLVVGLPFIILDALELWNSYYLALVYGCIMGVFALALSVFNGCTRYCHLHSSESRFNASHGAQLDDEDSIDIDSCISFETFEFIFSQKKIHSLVIHPFVSGVLSFAACYILLPSVMLEVLHVAGVVIVAIIGWLSLCSVQYSLNVSAPHEIATYRPTDPLELKFLNRTFYVMAVVAFFIPVRILVSEPTVYLQLLYSFLCLLPLGWWLGILPPLDALLPWIMEQALTRLMGGSHMATDFRLAVMFILSLSAVIIVASLTNHILSVLLATAFGFLLSQDIFLSSKALLSFLTQTCRIGSNLRTQLLTKTFISYSGFDFQSLNSYKLYLIHLVVSTIKGAIFLATGLTLIYFMFTLSSAEELVTSIITGSIIGFYVLLKISETFQSVYIFKIFRNPLFPKQCDNAGKFNKIRKRLQYLSIPRRLFVTYLSPLLLLAYVGLGLETATTSIPHIWYGVTAVRILRKIWQDTRSAHLELTVIAILYFAVPSTNSWSMLGLGTQSLIIGLALDIAQDFLKKLSFMATMFAFFLSDHKQRTYLFLNILIITGTIIFFPFVLAVVLISSVLSAPLLPLFTLPIFVVCFPRTRRFWPSLVDYGSTYSQCEDSVYYQQAEPEIVRVLHTAGCTHTDPGTFSLMRFEDRLIVATVLERGFGYCVLSIRGLELQETSCHTVEATRIDDIFESMYSSGTKTCLEFWFNNHSLNTLQPVDSAVIKTYSDAKNVLTGIIDQPSALERFSGNFLKTLVWVFYHHFREMTSKKNHAILTNGTTSVQQQHHHPHSDSGFAGSQTVLDQQPEERLHREFSNAWGEDQQRGAPVDQTHKVKENDNLSWSDSISSFDEVISPSHPTKLGGGVPLSIPTSPVGTTKDIPGLIPEDRPLDIQHVYSETTIDNTVSDVRLSAIPLSGVSTTGFRKSSKVFPGIISQGGWKVPSGWLEYPFSFTQIEKLVRQLFPVEWLGFIKDNSDSFELSSELELQLKKIVIACYSLTDVMCGAQLQGRNEQTKPYDIYKGFCGEFPYSVNLDWLTGDKTLHSLVLKAFRYAVKLMYDEASLGEVEDHQELFEYLESYDREHYIGSEGEPGWKESILKQTQHLFSLGRDLEKNVYTAHVLTLQEQVVHIGELNQAAVHAIWADLTFELFYLTNDDEERYSIQAHKTLMRNLTIQTADPPLGYSVYSSGLVRTPCT